MEPTRQDFLIGLLVVAAIGVVLGAVIATSGWGERRYDLFMRTESAEGITTDTRVFVQGLEVGRVKGVAPRVDSVSGRIAFVARLSLKQAFADGSSLRLPVGTRAEIDASSPISSAARIDLLPPDSAGPARAFIEAGDTIVSWRKGSAMEAVAQVAQGLSRQVDVVLRQTNRTLLAVEATVGHAERSLARAGPEVVTAVNGLARSVARIDSLVGRVSEAGLADSLVATLRASALILARLDSLTAQGLTLVAENRADLRQTVTNLTQVSRQLDHFVEEMSRRPYRLFTGVRPIPADSAASTPPARGDTAAATGTRP
ncbi:MAG: MlaD family protein [Acidimicrobiales bacterium]